MASYNMTKAADRARCRADRQAEIDAVRAGTWPRDINDSMRWGAMKVFIDAKEHAEYARKMCQAEIDYIDGVDARIKAGDPSVAGWEPQPTAKGEPVTLPLDGCCCKCHGRIPTGTVALFVRHMGLVCPACQEA